MHNFGNIFSETHADMNCLLGDTGEPTDINLFAYRVHAHSLGSVITGYLFDTTVSLHHYSYFNNITHILEQNE